MAQEKNADINPSGSGEPDILPELKSAAETEGKLNSLTLFIVTLVLFFSTGIVSMRWQDLVVLIGVLLFHELGHFLAMKALNYNDVKIFFVPFIGAAVTGKSQRETAVKSCLVSLAGPLPGIVVGIGLFLLFSVTKNYYVYKTAQVMLTLNTLNLLPIMPLDGGRCIDVLFVNRRFFRLALSLLGAGLFLLMAAVFRDVVLGVIGAFSVFSAVSQFKLHGLSEKLKAQGFQTVSVSALLEDRPALSLALTALREKFPSVFSPQLQARTVLGHLGVVVDTLKFTPAGFISKACLLGAYFVFLAASVIAATFFIGMNYNETIRTEVVDGKNRGYSERHFFGKKRADCPIDDTGFYDGQGTSFHAETGKPEWVFTYAKGYRQGEWVLFDKNGDAVEKRTYKDGRLTFISKRENGVWKATPFSEFSSWQKFLEELQRISQPYKSNHAYFMG